MSRGLLSIVALGVLVAAFAMFSSVSSRGRQVDDCVTYLQDAIQGKGTKSLGQLVKSSVLLEQLRELDEVDIAYARPKDSNWARVGMVIKSGEQAAEQKNQILGLLLDLNALPDCQFMRDYDKGPFGAHGRDGQLTKGSTTTSTSTQ